MNIILTGIQGCGKGTQAEKLSQEFKWAHVNIGAIFRDHTSRKTDLGEKAKSYMEKGDLVPDDLVFELISAELNKAGNGFILDGFPRNIAQLEYLLKKYKIDKFILLDLPDDIAIKRISSRRQCRQCKKVYNILFNPPAKEGVCDKCGGLLEQREDDNEKAVAVRLSKFYEETGKVVDYFRENDKLVTIDANRDIEIIFEDILTHLK